MCLANLLTNNLLIDLAGISISPLDCLAPIGSRYWGTWKRLPRPGGGANQDLSVCVYFLSVNQRLRPLDYCAPSKLDSIFITKSHGQVLPLFWEHTLEKTKNLNTFLCYKRWIIAVEQKCIGSKSFFLKQVQFFFLANRILKVRSLQCLSL